MRRYFQTGMFGDLHRGLSKEEVVHMLGEPEEAGGTSRKYPRPSIYLYGTLELFFRQARPADLIDVYWEAGERGELRLPPCCTLQDWALFPGMRREDVEVVLAGNRCEFFCPPNLQWAGTQTLILTSGVHITFTDDLLFAVSGLREE
ncbi:MAG: hypothetical protein KY468_12100 [Armatimonadetes bacterium]|nr:hypothetical protein [Armatimonadota bacterium]